MRSATSSNPTERAGATETSMKAVTISGMLSGPPVAAARSQSTTAV